jgi:hypothetical protein
VKHAKAKMIRSERWGPLVDSLLDVVRKMMMMMMMMMTPSSTW